MQNYKLEFSVEIDTYYPIVDAPGVIPETIGYTADIKDSVTYAEKLLESNDIRYGERNYEDTVSNLVPRELSTEMHNASGKMSVIASSGMVNEPHVIIKAKSPLTNSQYAYGQYVPIVWDTIGTVHNVDILYSDDGENWSYIVKGMHNIGQFAWEAPGNEIDITVTGPGTEAKLSASINMFGNVEKVTIIDKGRNYDETTRLDIASREGSGFVCSPIITSGEITGINIINAGKDYIPSVEKMIKIKIRNTQNHEVFDIIENVSIS
jgi:hypothetical protein